MRYKIHSVIKAAGSFFKELLTDKDRGTVIFFHHAVFDHLGLTANIDELMERLQIHSPMIGQTALHDAVSKALKVVEKASGWNIIVVFSDGGDNSSYTDRFTLLERVKKTNALIYTIENTDIPGKKDVLREMTMATGGTTFRLAEVKEIQNVYKSIREDIKARYLLVIDTEEGRVPVLVDSVRSW